MAEVCSSAKGKEKRQEAGEESAEIIVQRMSSDVSGKQQKYTRIWPQEYVPFEHEELSIANIKDACMTSMKYFRPQIEKDLICDVLAGECGPSCEKMAHIPNRKVFYVPFIKPDGGEVLSDEEGSPQCKKVRNHEDKISAQRHTFIIMHADISYYSETSIKQSPIERTPSRVPK